MGRISKHEPSRRQRNQLLFPFSPMEKPKSHQVFRPESAHRERVVNLRVKYKDTLADHLGWVIVKAGRRLVERRSAAARDGCYVCRNRRARLNVCSDWCSMARLTIRTRAEPARATRIRWSRGRAMNRNRGVSGIA